MQKSFNIKKITKKQTLNLKNVTIYVKSCWAKIIPKLLLLYTDWLVTCIFKGKQEKPQFFTKNVTQLVGKYLARLI